MTRSASRAAGWPVQVADIAAHAGTAGVGDGEGDGEGLGETLGLALAPADADADGVAAGE